MKTKTLIILFALVMALSVSAGVFAEEGAWDQTWDEETVLQYFSDLDLLYPDMFMDIDSDFLWTVTEDEEVIPEFEKKAISIEDTADYAAKAPIATDSMTVKATTDPCGDGLIKVEVTFTKDDTYTGYYGPEKTTYIRELEVKAGGNPLEIAKCTSSGGDNCRSVTFNKKGKATLTIYAYSDTVYAADTTGKLADEVAVEVNLAFSNYRTAFWDTLPVYVTPASGTLTATSKNYCQDSLQEFSPSESLATVRAKYDPNTGEARFQAFVANVEGEKNAKYKSYFAIPAEVIILDEAGNQMQHVKNYTCKYTIYNDANGAPRTDYCKYGEGIALSSNALIRFDITLDHLSSDVLRKIGKVNDEEKQDIPFVFRVGGMTSFVGSDGGNFNGIYDSVVSISDEADVPAFAPVDYPCPVVTRMQVMDPLIPFMPFYSLDKDLYDTPIEASGAYGIYDGGLWGMYQKCGKYAYMAVRLKNDGIKTQTIKLDKVAVAINGGTPMSWKWVFTTVEPEDDDNRIKLEAGKDVVLIGRAKVTDYVYQMNSDQAITGAINFLDYGFYIQGKVYSDHNNTNCTVAP